jgi:hypothetical protein
LDFQWALGDSLVCSQPLKSFSMIFIIRTASLKIRIPSYLRLSRLFRVLPLSELPFLHHCFRARRVAAPKSTSRCDVSISSVHRPRESHTLKLPFTSCPERFHCHFLQLPSYRQRFTVLFYLSRDSTRTRARSYFSRWRVRLRTSVWSLRQPCAFFSPAHRLSRLNPGSAP